MAVKVLEIFGKYFRSSVSRILMICFTFGIGFAYIIFEKPAVFHGDRGAGAPNYVRDVLGTISSVNDDGSITLVRGGVDPLHTALWGLIVTDIDGLRNFLTGRLVECKIVHELGPIPETDCLMYPQKNRRPLSSIIEMRGPISVFDWVSDHDFSTQKCRHENERYLISDGAGRFWSCTHNGEPSFGPYDIFIMEETR